MNSSINEELLANCLRKHVVSDKGKANASTITITSYEIIDYVVEEDRNYYNALQRVVVRYKYDQEDGKKSFIVKVPSSSRNYDCLAKGDLYTKETFMYENVLPAIAELLQFPVAPKHYCTIRSENLVLDDLTESGFWIERGHSLNLEESTLVLENLAKFHAASYKLRVANPSLLAASSADPNLTKSTVEAILDLFYPIIIPILVKENVSSSTIGRFVSFKEKILENDFFENSNGPFEFNVLNHGDLNYNNLLFKSDQNQKLTDVKFIDFQTCRWSSPATDIIYLATFSVDYNTFEKHFEDLLNSYLRSLNSTLEKLGCVVRYTKGQLNADMENLKLLRVVVLIIVIYFSMNQTLNNCQATKCVTPNPDVIDKICNDELFKRYFLLFKYYEKIGII